MVNAALCCWRVTCFPSNVIHWTLYDTMRPDHLPPPPLLFSWKNHKPSLPYFSRGEDSDISFSSLTLRTWSVFLILTKINLLFSRWIFRAFVTHTYGSCFKLYGCELLSAGILLIPSVCEEDGTPSELSFYALWIYFKDEHCFLYVTWAGWPPCYEKANVKYSFSFLWLVLFIGQTFQQLIGWDLFVVHGCLSSNF